MTTFDTFYDEAANVIDAADVPDHIKRGAVWVHRDGRALALGGAEQRRLSAEDARALIASGVVVRDSCPLSHNVDIYVLPGRQS